MSVAAMDMLTKKRVRSASSPIKVNYIPPPADELSALDFTESQDTSIDAFMNGLNRLNDTFKDSLMSEFKTARKQIIAFQTRQNADKIKDITQKLLMTQQELSACQQELSKMKNEHLKGEELKEKSWIYFEKNRYRADLGLFFAKWKSKTLSITREHLISHMAGIHYHANIMRKVMNGWRGVIGSTWKSTFERKIKREAEICMQEMSDKYESQISKIKEELNQTLSKLKDAESHRDMKEAEMKRALMRGVCALNMEAMSVFRDKTIIPESKKPQSISKEPDNNASEKFFEAIVIPKSSTGNTRKNVEFSGIKQTEDHNGINRILVTRHQ